MTEATKIRVLVVDDSAFMRTALTRMIESSSDLAVVDTACNGRDAVEKVYRLKPDVVTMDVEMPVMSGLEALSTIMRTAPCPVIMVSSLTLDQAEATIEALTRGAFDYLSKDVSRTSLDILRLREDLIAKCRAAAASRTRRPVQTSSSIAALPVRTRVDARSIRLVCIGTSTGGPKALQKILPMIPSDFPVPIAIVQHMPPGFTGPFARRLDGLCSLRVKEAEDRELLEPGCVYIGPAGQQLRVRGGREGAVAELSHNPAETLHIPSVDVLMLSAAEQFGREATGVILTGMGCDGLRGMTSLFHAGAITIGEDERTCTVYGMPRACAEAGVLSSVLPLESIPAQLTQIATKSSPRVLDAR